MNTFNGKEELLSLAKKAGFKSKFELISNYTLFVHPETVILTKNKNIFNIIRNFQKRGEIIERNGEQVMCCDNTGPTHAFEWSIGGLKKTDIQINHIYSESKNTNSYTSLANICASPSFLSKLTDTDIETKELLKYRSYDLYGFYINQIPIKPDFYDDLIWKEYFEPISDLKTTLIEKLKKNPKSRTAISVEKLGWVFS